MTMIYQYTQVNRLDEPHSYIYTPFEGEALLFSFKASRMASIRKLSETRSASRKTEIYFYTKAVSFLEKSFDSISVEGGDRFRKIMSISYLESGQAVDCDIYDDTVEGLSRLLPKFDVTEPVVTEDLLRSLVAAQLTNVHDTRIKEWTDRLIQRFEVTKKLYVTYPPGFRKGEGINSSVELYWLFALVLSMYYVTYRQVRYLSTLLKVCDLLCSLPDPLLVGHLSSDVMTSILATELVSIELLVEKRGIDVAFT